MKPLLLTMEAFGSYGKRTSISFEEPDQNLFLITGDTGAGKSTIFDAIVFALYGEASSNANRKDGAELQSQYAQPGMVPFVELTFSEGRGQAQKIYTVRRTPRYKRPLKRGSGMKDVSETVSLRLPDGTEYPPKETDKKLMELVGLTKAQFMQVAMIAQGEFMEFLRAKSDDKKAIFRKLFHTGQFQEITEEFGRRRKEKEEEISQIRTACRAEAARIVLPEEYQGDFLSEFRERVRGDGLFVKEDFEQLLSELEKLCLWLKKELTESEERYLSLSRQRDERRDELTRARQLQDLFAQLKEAEGQLELSLRQEGQINEAAALGERINRAYQILEAFGRFQEEARRAESCRDQLEQQKKRLPALKQGQEAADLKEAEEKEKLNQQLERFSRVSDRVNRAMDLFRKRSEAREETDQRKEQVRRAEVFFERAKKDQEEFEQKDRKWRQQSEQLSGAQQEFALWQVKWKGHEEQKKEAAAASLLGEEWEAQRSLLEEAVKRYGAAREHYQKKNSRYELLRQQFLDAQAGFLASQLKPGKPCPVCGSREHPSPCLGEGGEQAVSRQELDGLEAEVARLRASQEELAGKAQAKEALVREKGEQFSRELKKLKAALLETALPETALFGNTSREMKGMEPEENQQVPEPQAALEVLRQELERRELLLKQEGREAKRREQLCEQVRFNLSKADEEKAARAAQVEQARQTLEEARKNLEQSRARMGTYEKEIEYPDKEAARAEYAGAKARFESAKKAHEEVEGEAR